MQLVSFCFNAGLPRFIPSCSLYSYFGLWANCAHDDTKICLEVDQLLCFTLSSYYGGRISLRVYLLKGVSLLSLSYILVKN